MFGLAIVAAVFIATAWAGAAMAETQLEKVVWCAERAFQTCLASKVLPAGAKILATATNTEFLTSLGSISCITSELEMTNTGVLVHGDVTSLVFGECKREEAENCEVRAENLEYLFKGELVTDSPTSKYEVRFTEKENGLPKIIIECGTLINCRYTASEVSIEARLAFTPEILKLLQEFLVSEGIFCSENPIWHGTYNAECREKALAEIKRCWVKMES